MGDEVLDHLYLLNPKVQFKKPSNNMYNDTCRTNRKTELNTFFDVCVLNIFFDVLYLLGNFIRSI